METNGFQQYKDQSVNTMTQGELLLLLYDELVKRLVRSKLAFDKEDYQLFDSEAERSVEIIRYLDRTLDRRYEIGNDLHRLYDFFCYELSRVRFGRNVEELERVTRMVKELRESFQIAQKNNNSGK